VLRALIHRTATDHTCSRMLARQDIVAVGTPCHHRLLLLLMCRRFPFPVRGHSLPSAVQPFTVCSTLDWGVVAVVPVGQLEKGVILRKNPSRSTEPFVTPWR
jgi:hypothetical protein